MWHYKLLVGSNCVYMYNLFIKILSSYFKKDSLKIYDTLKKRMSFVIKVYFLNGFIYAFKTTFSKLSKKYLNLSVTLSTWLRVNISEVWHLHVLISYIMHLLKNEASSAFEWSCFKNELKLTFMGWFLSIS